MSNRAVKIFCSYSHKDEEYKDELETHLANLKRLGLIDLWTDRRILPGDNWDFEINDKLQNADIILLLISSDFIASNYCYDVEIKQAIKQHKEQKSITIPIALRECDWYDAPFSFIQGLPSDMKPIVSKNWFSKDEAYKDVSVNLRRLINEIINRKQTTEEKEYNELPNSIEALRDFISKYKEGEFVQTAKQRILQLDENNFWYKSEKSNSINDYESYLTNYPKGKYSEKAKTQIEKLKADLQKSKSESKEHNPRKKVEFSKSVQRQLDELIKMLTTSTKLESFRYPFNFLFVGGPGTGKSTCARELGNILYENGLLSKGHTIEVSRADLIAGYVGQTAIKVKKVIESAVGGVLIIDEAYQLLMGSSDTFGMDAINGIIKGMEDYRSEICFIFTGYKHEIDKLLQLNPGLKRRMVSTINFNPEKFEDYLSFMDKKLESENLNFKEETYLMLQNIIKKQYEEKGVNFGGFRFIGLLISEVTMRFFIRCDSNELDINETFIQNEDIPDKYKSR